MIAEKPAGPRPVGMSRRRDVVDGKPLVGTEFRAGDIRWEKLGYPGASHSPSFRLVL